MSGVIPALPLIIIRPFLPESPAWQAEAGGRHAEAAEPRRALHARSCAARRSSRRSCSRCAYGAAFGAIQHMPRIVRGLPEVASAAAPRQAARPPPTCSGGRRSAASSADSRSPCSLLVIVSRRSLLRRLSDPGADRRAAGLLDGADERRRDAEDRHVLRGLVHRGAVQLLGQLPAAHVPDAPARHGRGLRRERRRPHARARRSRS